MSKDLTKIIGNKGVQRVRPSSLGRILNIPDAFREQPRTRSHHRWAVFYILALLLLFFTTPAIKAEAPPGQPYTFQTDDSLAKLAEKFLDDVSFWPAILVATRAKANESHRFGKIYHPGQLRAGHTLWIPAPDGAEQLLAQHAARPQRQPLTAETLAEFEAYIETIRARYEIPGAVVLVIKEGQIVLAKGYGVRTLGQADPVTPETLFPIGSTTKALNALMIATMVDERRLDWDQPALEIWPDFVLSDLAHTQQVRLRDLLNMSSGLPRRDLIWSGANLTAEQLLTSLSDLPIYSQVGEQYYYNNQAVAAGGYLAAIAAGGRLGQLQNAYAAELQRHIFDPIGMPRATTSLETALTNPNRATPHDLNLYGEIVPTHDHPDVSITPAGGVYASGLDLARFLQVQLNEGLTGEGQRIVSAENLRETQRPQTAISNQLSYGMGWFIEDYRGVEIIWHDGDVLGSKALLAMIPEAELGLVVLSNRILSTMFSAGLQYRLAELAYDLPPEAEATYDQMWSGFQKAIVEIRAELNPTVNPAEVAPYLGPYSGEWVIELRDNQLFATRGPYEWHLLQAAEAGHFVVNNGFGIGINLTLAPDEATGRMTMSFRLPTGEPGYYERLAEN